MREREREREREIVGNGKLHKDFRKFYIWNKMT